MPKIKILANSNYSRMITGFGKNMKNILLALHDDPEFEVIEAANGVQFGKDAKTPWKCYGTAPSSPEVIKAIQGNEPQQRAAAYGFYEIDKIIELEKPDIYLGIEDIWAFNGFKDTKPWWNTTRKIIWTTLDSIPILDDAFRMTESCDKFLVWASFAEEEMRKNGVKNVETLHGAIDLSHFYPLDNRENLRKKHDLDQNFVVGFVFKNQLRKSVPNLLEGFKLFQKRNPDSKAKLLLHTDWGDIGGGWDIPRFIKEKQLEPKDILCAYKCEACGEFDLSAFTGSDIDCPFCDGRKTLKTKTSMHGLSENQLNYIYNLMDVYCHPFTSGGQELPIQEAKAAGLITLVTEYSCGTDCCYEHQGGLPLAWNEYREPHSQFIKSSTCPESICERLEEVYSMSPERKAKLVDNARTTIQNKFSCDKIVSRLKEIFREVLTKNPVQFEQKTEEEQKKVSLESLLDGEKENRILIAIPESKEDVFLITSLLPSIKRLYPEKNIYFSTNPENQEILLGNPYIHKVLNFHPLMENTLYIEGKGAHKGYFQICFLPHLGTQKMIDYIHNASDKIDFDLLCT
jgi:glycosyltransferase involved in cell wall biosynthesis